MESKDRFKPDTTPAFDHSAPEPKPTLPIDTPSNDNTISTPSVASDNNSSPISHTPPVALPVEPPSTLASDQPKMFEPELTVNPTESSDLSTQQTLPRSNRKGWLIAAIMAAAVVGGGLYYWLAIRDDAPKKTTLVIAPTAQKKPIPLMRFGTQEGLVSAFYPDENSISSTGGIAIVRQVFEGLVGYGPNQQFVPLLATSWTNPDAKTWIFRLKPNVGFHNGKTMTAQDVKASLEADTPSSSQYNIPAVVQSVEVVDAQTIKITTKAADALLLNRLVNMFIFDSAATEKNSPANGTGPMTLKPSKSYDENQIELVAFTKYHGDKPLVAEIVAKNYASEEELVKAAKENKVDVGTTFSLTDGKAIAAANSGVKYREVESLGSTVLQPITLKTGSPIQKKQVRQAIYQTIDPQLVIKASGLDGEVANQLVPQSVPGYDSTITRPKINIEAAKGLLKEAGYPNGLTLSVFYGPAVGSPADKAVKEIARQLEQIGVKLEYNIVKSFNEFTDATLSYKYDLSYSTNLSDFYDASDIITINLTKDGTIASYDNATVNSLLAKAAQEFDAAKRIKIMQEVSRTLMDDVATIPIRTPLKAMLLRTNYNAPFDLPDSSIGAYLYKFYQQ